MIFPLISIIYAKKILAIPENAAVQISGFADGTMTLTSTDAASVLLYAAAVGAGEELTLEQFLAR